MSTVKVYIRKPKPGLSHFPGEVVSMDSKRAEELYEGGFARPAKEVLPNDLPGRQKLLRRGIETLEELKEMDNFQGLGLSDREQKGLVTYFSGSTLPEDLPGRDAFEEAGIESVEQILELEDPTKVKGIGAKTAEELAEYLASK